MDSSIEVLRLSASRVCNCYHDITLPANRGSAPPHLFQKCIEFFPIIIMSSVL